MSGIWDGYFCTPKLVLIHLCESSSFGRARPCQGRGGRFEPGLSLQESRRAGGVMGFFLDVPEGVGTSPGGGIGRHAGLKIL